LLHIDKMPDAIVKSISGIFFYRTNQSRNQETKKMNQERRKELTADDADSSAKGGSSSRRRGDLDAKNGGEAA
jgi:hypothetical protein